MTLTHINYFFSRFCFHSFILHHGDLSASYPAMGTVKGAIVPEDQRAAIYNVFRFPLNLFILIPHNAPGTKGESAIGHSPIPFL